MVEHSTADREVTGSIPVAPFRFKTDLTVSATVSYLFYLPVKIRPVVKQMFSNSERKFKILFSLFVRL